MAEINLIKEETIQVDLTSENPIDAQVPEINYIPGYKIAEEERRKNEIERVTNENERIEYYEEVRRDVENGEFDGKNTVYVGETEPIDDYYEVWVNPEGTPIVEAENIVMEDGETLQDKYDNGKLIGPRGEKGDKGDKGDTGETGLKGEKGDKGDPGETPDLSNYATKEYVKNEMTTLEVDLTPYYTKTEIDNTLNQLQDNIEEDLNKIGSCASFSKSSNQGLENYFVYFNTTDYVDNECFELAGYGKIKVLKDISRVQVNYNICFGIYTSVNEKSEVTLHCYSTEDTGFKTNFFVSDKVTISASGILKVKKDSIIRIDTNADSAAPFISSDSKEWCVINLCVLK